ncbi:hypothetical protein [Streptomyces lydicus]|uniref:hypothetical protein n=1 Tax=Streptomyces lydicus TaxID=47763 RepID=UPI0037B5EA6F
MVACDEVAEQLGGLARVIRAHSEQQVRHRGVFGVQGAAGGHQLVDQLLRGDVLVVGQNRGQVARTERRAQDQEGAVLSALPSPATWPSPSAADSP